MCWFEDHAGHEDGFLSVHPRLWVDMRARLCGCLFIRMSAFMCWYVYQAMRMASYACICVYVLIWWLGYEGGFLSVYMRLCANKHTRLWGWLLVRISAFMCWYKDQAMRMASCLYVCFCVLIWWPGRLWRWLFVRRSASMCWYGEQALRLASYP